MKPEFVKYLHADSILVLEGETKKAVLEEIITYATTRCTMDEAQLREAIWKREKMMTTGIGNGQMQSVLLHVMPIGSRGISLSSRNRRNLPDSDCRL